MTRLITQHALRRVTSPSPLWTLSAPDLPDFPPACTFVPGDARMVPGLADYSGRLSYEKKITCAGTLRILLHGVDGQAQVWLDDNMIAEGSGCVTALVEDIPYEQHVLRVDVTGGCGLIRPVTIEQMGGALPVIVSVLTAAVSGFLAIKLMLAIVKRVGMRWFAVYTFLLGAFMIAYQVLAM